MKKWQLDIDHLQQVIKESTSQIHLDEDLTPLFAVLAAADFSGCTLLVLPNSLQAERTINNVRHFVKLAMLDINVLFCPESDLQRKDGGILSENSAQRCRVLETLINNRPSIIVASLGAVLSPTLMPVVFKERCIYLDNKMHSIEPQLLATKLLNLDYDNEVEVHVPGEFALRGGVIDLFSPLYTHPVRVDFWGDEIESIRFFSSTDQRSIKTIESVIITPCSEGTEDLNYDLLDYLTYAGGEIITLFPDDSHKHAAEFFAEKISRVDEIINKSKYCFVDGGEKAIAYSLRHLLGSEGKQVESLIYDKILESQLLQWNKRYKIYGAFKEERVKKYFEQCIQKLSIEQCTILDVWSPIGFIVPSLNFVVLSDREVIVRHEQVSENLVAQVRDYDSDWTIRDDIGINVGDYIVHVNYGIGEFQGVTQIEQLGEVREVLELCFADDVTIYVPMNQAHLVSRYVGQGGTKAKLSKVGSTRWKTKMHDAEDAVRDFASELLRLQAVRSSIKGLKCDTDDQMQEEFEATFSFEATEDQLKAFEDVKLDMQAQQPMDRLLCGDVGYGKTEVAIRAAFRAVMNGFQVAVVAPTTILAQQHYDSFSARMNDFPVMIDILSRFKALAQQRVALNSVERGDIDIIIGTHRLLQKDVKFHNLGLVIIDEEQKFGVVHKEFLKQMRTSVDVLTMSATPIPRTLYMSLIGARNLSTINTPPHQRLAVKTIVSAMDDDLMSQAINRELERDGQIFILHNRVRTIDTFAEKIRAIVPHARVVVGHGQMPPNELEEVMHKFIKHQADILVSTTIIENGVDVPNANTIIIDRADRFGLSELYQIRGRVGRSHRQAYAYLFIPPSGILTGNARERIAAIKKYTHLGAGFKLALRDLEIRGSGDILGAEQSGYIATIGFELYCEMLRDTINRLKNLPKKRSVLDKQCVVKLSFLKYRRANSKIDSQENVLSASIPERYMPEENLRVEAYRKLAMVSSTTDLENYMEEITDRFGRMPQEVINLFALSRITLMAESRGIHSLVERHDGRLFMENDRGNIKIEGKIPVLVRDKPQIMLLILEEILEKVPLINRSK